MPRTTTVHLLTGDYPDRLAALALAAQEALKDESPRTMLDEHPYESIQREYAELKAEAIEAGTTVNLVAVNRSTWRKLKALHPPREGEAGKADREYGAGVNVETIDDDLTHAALAEGEEGSCALDMKRKDDACSDGNPCSRRHAFDRWADRLSAGEWGSISVKAFELTVGVSRDPKDLPPLPTTPGDSNSE